jgi:EmrB/QacA subfamily drug resistance transporter
MENVHVGRTLTVLMAGAFIAILNQTLINVAIPHMMSDLNVSATTIQWLSTAYMLVNGVLIPISAFLIERFGIRPLFIFAMSAFTAGSVVCALSPNFTVTLLGRIIQASGAGILMPLIMNVFLILFPPERRGAAMGTMGIVMIFAPAVGPTLAGWIVEKHSWRMLFAMMIPLGLIDLLLSVSMLQNISKVSRPKLDVPGFIFSTIGFGALLYGFSEAGTKSWSSASVLTSLIAGSLFVVLFIWRELTMEAPMLDFRVFRYDVFTITTIIGAAINMAMFGAMILLPIYLQNIRGFTPLQSGLLLMPGALLMGVMSPISGALFDRIGARPLAVVGLIITTITTYEFSKLTSDTPYSHIMGMYTMRMFGMSLLMMSVQTAGLNQLPRRLGSHGTAMSNTMRQISGSIGTALLVTIMSNRTTYHMNNYAGEVTVANSYVTETVQRIGQGLAVMAGLPPASSDLLAAQTVYGLAAQQSAISGINDAFVVATGITVAGLFFSFFVRRIKASDKNAESE